jgi:hypothetical protein
MEFCLERARAMVQMSDGLSIENTRCATLGGLLVSGRDELEANICNAKQPCPKCSRRRIGKAGARRLSGGARCAG